MSSEKFFGSDYMATIIMKIITLDGGGGGGKGVYKSADPPKFEAKFAIRQWSCLNLDPLKALLKSQSRIRTKLQAKSTIRAKILDKSPTRCIKKKNYSPPPPPRSYKNLNTSIYHINTS